MLVKKDLMYTKSHEWVKSTGPDMVRVGLTDYAQEALGDIVFVNLPSVSDPILVGEVLGDVESVKAVSDIYSPITGVVEAVNELLLDEPGQINDDPYDAWLVEIGEVALPEELMGPEEYEAYVAGLD